MSSSHQHVLHPFNSKSFVVLLVVVVFAVMGVLTFVTGKVATTDAVASPASAAVPANMTFSYTGSAQSWTPPAGVNTVLVQASGGGGGGTGGGPGGNGALVTAYLPVDSAGSVKINVGAGGLQTSTAGGGGAATSVVVSSSDFLVAGGGGGGGNWVGGEDAGQGDGIGSGQGNPSGYGAGGSGGASNGGTAGKGGVNTSATGLTSLPSGVDENPDGADGSGDGAGGGGAADQGNGGSGGSWSGAGGAAGGSYSAITPAAAGAGGGGAGYGGGGGGAADESGGGGGGYGGGGGGFVDDSSADGQLGYGGAGGGSYAVAYGASAPVIGTASNAGGGFVASDYPDSNGAGCSSDCTGAPGGNGSVALTWLQQPVVDAVINGTTASVSWAEPDQPVGDVTYQLYLNGTAVSGATSSPLTTTVASGTAPTAFTVVATSSGGLKTTSNPATTIANPVTNLNVQMNGTTATVTWTTPAQPVSGVGYLLVSNGDPIPGQSSPATVSGLTAGTSYTFIVLSEASAANSSSVQSASVTVTAGTTTSATPSASASAGSSLTYDIQSLEREAANALKSIL